MFQVRNILADTAFVLPLEETDARQTSLLPTNVWLFTDPLAKAIYTQRGDLPELEQDIRTFAMFQNKWGPDELEFKQEIEALCDAKLAAPEIAFGNVSPHPTIYKALRPGKIEIFGEKYHFHTGDEIVFAPWPERLSHPGISEPLRIGRFDAAGPACLCRQAYPQLNGLSLKEFEVLHQIACYPKNRSS